MDITTFVPPPIQQAPPPRNSTRTPRLIGYLQDYHHSLDMASGSTNAPSLACDQGIKYPLSSILSYNALSCPYKSFVFNITSHTDPKTYDQAVKLEC